eukprot:c28687_g2_i4 orf=466-2238(+)
MEAMTSADRCRSPPCVFVEESLVFESATDAERKKRTEIRRMKQQIASAANVLQAFNNKRSRSLSAPSCEECNGEQLESPLREPLSEGDVPRSSQPLRQIRGIQIRGQTFDTAGGAGDRCGGLFRSASFPPEGWERGAKRCILKISKTSRISTAGKRDGKCLAVRPDSGSGGSMEAVSQGSSTSEVADAASTAPSPLHDKVLQDAKREEKSEAETDKVEKSNVTLGEGALLPKSSVSAAATCSNIGLPKLIAEPLSSPAGKSCALDGRCPPHGKLSVMGRRREMEDAVTVVPYFVNLPCDAIGGCCDSLPGSNTSSALHFFGVYDGHGGAQASTYCEQRLHNALAEEIIKVASLVKEDNNGSDSCGWASRWKSAMTACFLKMDTEVGGVCPHGKCSDFAGSSNCCSDTVAPGAAGSTAVVAVVSPCQMIIANCGDSRAVLSRAGKAIALSRDHKPEREDERSRIEAAGGRVVNWDGYRVGGLLAMSRAIGDRFLKPYVIAEPEVICIERTEDDECLILASDGLWDVVSNDVACDVARRCLIIARRKLESGRLPPTDGTPATTAAALLTKLALAKGSKDNISVVVVDFKTKM